jgi:hypothetical protein
MRNRGTGTSTLTGGVPGPSSMGISLYSMPPFSNLKPEDYNLLNIQSNYEDHPYFFGLGLPSPYNCNYGFNQNHQSRPRKGLKDHSNKIPNGLSSDLGKSGLHSGLGGKEGELKFGDQPKKTTRFKQRLDRQMHGTHQGTHGNDKIGLGGSGLLTKRPRGHVGRRPNGKSGQQQPRVFRCPLDSCGKVFLDRASLKKHNTVHGDKLFQCTHEGCGKRFLDNAKLKRHMLVHTVSRLFLSGC